VPKRSAGIVLWRRSDGGEPEVLLVHPGGPFWARRDLGSWSIPKGEVEPEEDPRACALRELEEETGLALDVDHHELVDLGAVRQRNGKIVAAFALQGDLDPAAIVCRTTFELEWPPRSGRVQAFPEVDRAAWLTLPAAREKLLPAQVPFLDRLPGEPRGNTLEDPRYRASLNKFTVPCDSSEPPVKNAAPGAKGRVPLD
jgi:predicted NUDIX family NTP pyrophosphohydrolase